MQRTDRHSFTSKYTGNKNVIASFIRIPLLKFKNVDSSISECLPHTKKEKKRNLKMHTHYIRNRSTCFLFLYPSTTTCMLIYIGCVCKEKKYSNI